MPRPLFLVALLLVALAPPAAAQSATFTVEITAPPAAAGVYTPSTAPFGPSLLDVGPISAGVVLLDDGVGVGSDACEPLTPSSAAAVSGKIALVDRGTCTFASKTARAQAAGAVAVLLANNTGGTVLPAMGGSDPTITIPTLGITQDQGTLFKANLAGLAATLTGTPPVVVTGPAACTDGAAEIYACNGVDLAYHLALHTFSSPGSPTPNAGNDIWGWTDPLSGREYALVGLDNGTAFVDVTVPDAPVYLGKLPTATFASSWRDIKVYQNHAFIVSEASSHGMQVFDLTRLRSVASPPETFTADARYTGAGSSHNVVIDEGSALAVIVGATQSGFTCNGGGLHMVDISAPTAPTFAGCFDADGYTHDAQCLVYDGPDTDHTGRTVCFALNEDTVTIVDVTTPAAPTQLARVFYPSPSYTHQGWLSADRRHLIVNDELDGNASTPTRTLVMDVADLDNPGFQFAYDGTSTSRDHNLYVRGGHAFLSNYAGGLRIADVSGLATDAMQEVASFDTYPTDDAFSFNGQWSNYPYFLSGTVVANDINGGLFVLQPDLLRPGRATVTGGPGWRLLAAPAAGVTVDDLAALNLVQGVPGYYPPPQAQPNLYTAYDGTAYTASSGTGEALALGRGFWWYLYDQDLDPGGPSQSTALPMVLTTDGTPTASDVDVPLHGNGFVMAGNPFGTSLDLSGLGAWAWTGGTPVQTTAHVWDAATSGFLPSLLEPVVSTWQGVFLESSSAGTLTVPASARTTGGALLRTQAPALLAFELAAVGGAERDRAAVLHLRADASDGHDRHDAAKLEPVAERFVALAFEDASGGLRSVESRSPEAASFTVPLHVQSAGAGAALELTWPRMQGLPEAWTLTLRDLETGAEVDLRSATRYAFSVQPSAARERQAMPAAAALAPAGLARFVLDVRTGVVDTEAEGAAPALALDAPRPNPTTGATHIGFVLGAAAHVRLSVLDVQGREVAVLLDAERPAGAGSARLDAASLASGVYVVRLAAGGEIATRRLAVSR